MANQKNRHSVQIEPPNETALSSIAHNRLISVLTRSIEIRQRISLSRDIETLQFARALLIELEEAIRFHLAYCDASEDDYDDYRDAKRLQNVLQRYISSFER